MKLFISICLLFTLFLNPSIGYSQKGNPKEVEISGVRYLIHPVKKSETVFSICQKYKITQKELTLANPGLTTVLEAGTTVKIPIGKVAAEPKKQDSKTTQTPAVEYYYHKVANNQTLISIAKQYGITIKDLIRINPELSNGLEIGQVLKIPVSVSNSDGKSGKEVLPDSREQESLKDYSIHPVVSGETLYSLERQYDITHEEMLRLNPALQNGLKSGMKLKIPAQHDAQAPASEKNEQSYIKYKVENGETIFSLSSRFGIEAGELKKANPSLLSRSLESGEIILIPQNVVAKNKIADEQKPDILQNKEEDSAKCNPISDNNLQKYRVGLLLPLNLPGNDKIDQGAINKTLLLSKINLNNPAVSASPDTTLTLNGMNIDQKTEGFIEFYEGALLAIDSLQKKGMNIELFVFDVTTQERINAILQLEEFRDLNLIIGPVYPELQESVASFAAKNRIPMISPLSSAGSYEQNNSWYFKVNPTKEIQLEQTATYIANEFSKKNFFLLQQSGNSSTADAQLANLCKEKLSNQGGSHLFHEYNLQENGVNSIKPLMDENGENIFVIPTDNEAQVSVAVTNLTALAEHYNIVLMGTPTLTRLKSIQTENYHRIRLRYLSPYFIDYTKPLVNRFVSNYRETYSAEPSQYSFQGFDVSYYFLSALFKYGKDFRTCLPNYPMELTQMVFNFVKVSPMGGSMNHGMFVTGYERNFDVVNYGIAGELGKK